MSPGDMTDTLFHIPILLYKFFVFAQDIIFCFQKSAVVCTVTFYHLAEQFLTFFDHIVPLSNRKFHPVNFCFRTGFLCHLIQFGIPQILLKFVPYNIQLLHLVSQIESGCCRECKIHGISCQPYIDQYDSCFSRNHFHQIPYNRLKYIKQNQCEKSPCYRTAQADLSLKVKLFVAVIPPVGVKNSFHQYTCHIFQNRGDCHPCKIEFQNVSCHRT